MVSWIDVARSLAAVSIAAGAVVGNRNEITIVPLECLLAPVFAVESVVTVREDVYEPETHASSA